jgi:hypothetical protein
MLAGWAGGEYEQQKFSAQLLYLRPKCEIGKTNQQRRHFRTSVHTTLNSLHDKTLDVSPLSGIPYNT